MRVIDTIFERAAAGDIDYFACLLYGAIAGTEERILGNLSALGIDASLCTLSQDARIAQIKQDLLEEEPYDT